MLLGKILRREGFCPDEDILEALDAQAAGDERSLGETLLAKGKITRDQLEKALAIQRREQETD